MRSAALLVALVAVISSCAEDAPGEWSELRYFAELPGMVPMRLLPPIADRQGHIYVLHGDSTRIDVLALIGSPEGRWSGGCDLKKGDTRGVHGWVGTDDSHAWYWAGDALVALNGETNECDYVLDRDPASNASVRFAGVFPWIENTPSATKASAVIHAGGSDALYHVTIELDYDRYSRISPIEPVAAEGMTVVGVGANPKDKQAFLLLSYSLNGSPMVEARILDMKGETVHSAVLENRSELAEDAVTGYLQGAGGLIAGLLHSGDVIIYTDNSARLMRAPGEMVPAGVHRWHDQLWLVGTIGNVPHIAQIYAGGIGDPVIWTTSDLATSNVTGPVEVIDERNELRYRVAWNSQGSAIGEFAFVAPHGPTPYTSDSTIWLVAGPSFDNGVEGMTAVAIGSVAITYP